MPLAIELAAGRLSSLGLSDVTGRLDRALDVLGAGPRAGERHGSLRAAITWSYELLPEDERRLFRALAVFPDGFDLRTAEDVAREVAPGTDPTTAVGHLVDASMLIARFGKVLRYRMLETLRSFALDRQADAGELEEATSRFVAWAVRLVRRIDADVITEDEAMASDRLLAEVGNLRAAWAAARARDDLDAAAAIVVSLW